MAKIIYGIMSDNGTKLQTHDLEEGGVINDGDKVALNPGDYRVISNNVRISGKSFSKIELINDRIELGDGTVSQDPPCQSMVLTKNGDGEFSYVKITT
jgi:hypothetical protein